jgi:hypothetical protein
MIDKTIRLYYDRGIRCFLGDVVSEAEDKGPSMGGDYTSQYMSPIKLPADPVRLAPETDLVDLPGDLPSPAASIDERFPWQFGVNSPESSTWITGHVKKPSHRSYTMRKITRKRKQDHDQSIEGPQPRAGSHRRQRLV